MPRQYHGAAMYTPDIPTQRIPRRLRQTQSMHIMMRTAQAASRDNRSHMCRNPNQCMHTEYVGIGLTCARRGWRRAQLRTMNKNQRNMSARARAHTHTHTRIGARTNTPGTGNQQLQPGILLMCSSLQPRPRTHPDCNSKNERALPFSEISNQGPATCEEQGQT